MHHSSVSLLCEGDKMWSDELLWAILDTSTKPILYIKVLLENTDGWQTLF